MITDRALYGSPWGPRSLARFVWIKWFAALFVSDQQNLSRIRRSLYLVFHDRQDLRRVAASRSCAYKWKGDRAKFVLRCES